MKKNSAIAMGIVVIIVLVIVGFLIFHKPAKTPTASTNTSKSSVSNPNQAAAVNNAALKTKTSSTLGQYLTDSSGNTLYTYGGDSSGKSTVTGSLLASWPAYQDTGSMTGLPASVGTIMRSDNSQMQFTYKGMPLYTFVSDSPGQVTGDGISNFTVAKP